MSDWTIRRPTFGDLAALPGIERSAGEVFRHAPGLETIADAPVRGLAAHRRMNRIGLVLVASDSRGAPCGFIEAERFPDAVHVWEISVRRERQGEGIGRALIAAASARAIDAGADALTLTTFVRVSWNAPFYARLGFRQLTGRAVNARLTRVLASESAHPLPAGERCAMRLRLV